MTLIAAAARRNLSREERERPAAWAQHCTLQDDHGSLIFRWCHQNRAVSVHLQEEGRDLIMESRLLK